MSWTLPGLLAACGGELVRWGPGPFRGVSTDSRHLVSEHAFVALGGPTFDGHDFIPAALARGASAVIAARDLAPAAGAATWIRVGDGLRALGDLAAARRRELPVAVIGVTGSNGKTTTKEMIAAVLGSRGAKVEKSRGTENNLVGLPHTLLRLVGDEDFAVVEMGMNHPGEIWRLAEIARPNVAVITNIGPAHLEGLGSIANVAAAKEELVRALDAQATFVVNAADPYIAVMAERFSGRKVFVGPDGAVRLLSSAPTAGGQRIEIEVEGKRASVELGLRGVHNAENALLAAAVGGALGFDVDSIAAGLSRVSPPPMRLEVILLKSGARVLNDAYNANPASMVAALAALAAEPAKRRIAVLGEMWELGPEAARYHREVGAAAAQAGVDELIAVGRHAEDIAAGAEGAGLARVEAASTAADASRRVPTDLGPGDVVLVKGSRGAKLEEVVQLLRSET